MPDVSVNILQTNVTANAEAANVSANVEQADVTVNVGLATVSANIETANITVNISGAPGPPGTGGGSSTFEITAGEDLDAPDLIYIAADGKAYKADANGSDKDAIACVQDEILTDATGDAYLPPVVLEGFSGLTPNTRFFLSDSVPGGMMEGTPAQDGTEKIVQQVSKAISATAVLFAPGDVTYIPGAAPAEADYRITEAGDSRVTESGDFRIIESASTADYRITESGDSRITEGGDARIIETITADYRTTEGGDNRITETGDFRINE